jgi:hypothetical protein
VSPAAPPTVLLSMVTLPKPLGEAVKELK